MNNEPQLDPIPGAHAPTVTALGIVTAVCIVGLIALSVTAIFVDGLGTTVLGALIVTVVAVVAFGIVLVQRRDYLRKVRNGDVIDREPWSGPDLPYTG